MGSLSREIAKWLQSNPGPISGQTSENVWLQAKMKFIFDRRWREEFDISTFMQYMSSLGYRLEHRSIHTDGKETGLLMLALPSPHKGF